jgi:hypothetical protein
LARRIVEPVDQSLGGFPQNIRGPRHGCGGPVAMQANGAAVEDMHFVHVGHEGLLF